MAKKKSPNILLLMADQLAPHALPVHGHPLVNAPNLMRLAEDGGVFDNAYCNFPLCVPSRMSMLSGRLAHNIGSWDNATELPAATPTPGTARCWWRSLSWVRSVPADCCATAASLARALCWSWKACPVSRQQTIGARACTIS